MKKKIISKLRGNGGESIGETLIALLISALALVMLAGAITSASNIINGSKTAMDDYYKTQVNNRTASNKSFVNELENVIPALPAGD